MLSIQPMMQTITHGTVPIVWVLLFLTSVVLIFFIVYFRALRRWKRMYKKRSQSVVKGLVNEQFAPLMTHFPGTPSDARFLGKPVDYIIFNGLSDGFVDEVIFVEVKSKRGIGLTPNERLVRDAIRDKRVRWTVYTVESDTVS